MKQYFLSGLIVFFLSTHMLFADGLWLPRIFSDNMVLQREMSTPVWGKALPGATVSVEIGGNIYKTIAATDGKWMIKLAFTPAGGPYEIKIIADKTITFKNVMFGDVWFASGQSNMEFEMYKTMNAAKEITEANYTSIRLFFVPKTLSNAPKEEVPGGPWRICNSESVKNFSAVAYFFGRKLFLDKNIPIGLIDCSWGGTPAEYWTSQEMVSSFPEFKKQINEFNEKKLDDSFLAAGLRKDSIKWVLATNSTEGLKKNVHKSEYNDSRWEKMNVPTSIDDSKIGPYEGLIWFRKTVTLPKDFVGKDLSLKLGKIDLKDVTYVNGQEVGHILFNGNVVRTYIIPATLVKTGKIVIAIQVVDFWGKGGLLGPSDSMFINTLDNSQKNLSLAGEWKYSLDAEPAVPENKGFQNAPGLIFNAMVAPVIPYGIKGAIWYQGEANAWRAYQYRSLLPTMITDWRVRWGEGYFPFFMVQLANYMEVQKEPEESQWAELREAQMMTTNYPNVGIASAIDIGDAVDIHPTNKQDVGKRLALAAEHMVYGDNIVYSGPAYLSMQIVNSQIRLKFDHIGGGLVSKGNQLKGFVIAGADKKFYWADAKINGDEVIVSSDKVAAPVVVRYAWANNPIGNLYNKEGLPAWPFRTDDWPGLTINNK